jgi:hypothetical protein
MISFMADNIIFHLHPFVPLHWSKNTLRSTKQSKLHVLFPLRLLDGKRSVLHFFRLTTMATAEHPSCDGQSTIYKVAALLFLF